jgi:hypothetical protein
LLLRLHRARRPRTRRLFAGDDQSRMPLTLELASSDARQQFERQIVELIEQGHLRRADFLLREAIRAVGSPDLAAAAEPPANLSIERWVALGADMLDADRFMHERDGHPAAAVTLELVNRDTDAQLLIERTFHAATVIEQGRAVPDRAAAHWRPDFERADPIAIHGLERLMAIERQKMPSGTATAERERIAIDIQLAGLLLLVRYHQLVARALQQPGLPRPIVAQVGVHRTPWPMEPGVYDYAAEAIVAQRREAGRVKYDAITAQFVTEMREKRFLLQHWPWWKNMAQRANAVGLFESNLALTFGQLMERGKPPAWDAPEAEFEAALRDFATSRNPRDLDAVLGSNPSDDRSQLHLMFMDHALQFGGRNVQKHWLRSRGHDV